MKLREYQKQGVDFLKGRKFACLGDDPGLGKTAQAVCALPPDAKVLVICPAQVKYGWAKEFRQWRGVSSSIINKGTDKLNGSAVTIINYDLLIRKPLFNQFRDRYFDVIICDEAHRLKNPKAKRTKAVLSRRGLLAKTESMWFLTGTPIKNRPIDLWPMLSSTAPEVLKPYHSYLEYAYRYCGAYEDNFGLNTSGASNTNELFRKLKPFLLRRRKREVLEELPPRILDIVEFDCTKAVRRVIQDEENAILEELGDRDASDMTLASMTRIRKVLAKYKTPDALAFIKNLLEEVEKVVVFFYHHDTEKALKEGLKKYGTLTIDGSTPANKRPLKVQAFCEREDIRVFLGQMQACGEAIDGLQHASRVCVFVEPSWSATDIEQCIGRLERLGQKDPVNAYLLVIKDTLESDMLKTCVWKEKITKEILGDNKQQKEKKMYLEERVTNLEKALNQQTEALNKLIEFFRTSFVSVDTETQIKKEEGVTKVKAKKEKPSQEASLVSSGKKKEKKKEEPTETPTPAAKVSLEELRDLANKISEEQGGFTRCTDIIFQVGGTGAKLADLDSDELLEVKAKFEEELEK